MADIPGDARRPGILSVERVLEGSYSMILKNPRFKDLQLPIRVHRDLTSDLGILELEDLPRIHGRILGPDGKPLAGVWIGIDEEPDELWTRSNPEKGPEQFEARVLAVTTAEGLFRLPIKDSLTVLAFKPGYVPSILVWSLSASMKAGRPAKSELPTMTLRRAGQLLVRAPTLTKTKGSRWVAKLRLIPESTPLSQKKRPHIWTKSKGLNPREPALFLGLRPGRYRLTAADFSKGRGLVTTTIPGQSFHGTVEIRAGRRSSIRLP